MSGTLVFDGGCGFCTSSARLLARLAPAVRIVPWQCADLPALGLDADRARRAVQWVGTDGVRAEGETAVAGALRTAGRAGQFAAAAILAARPVSGWVYRWVSEHRGRLPGGPPACRGPHA